jgi:hypothetical protein
MIPTTQPIPSPTALPSTQPSANPSNQPTNNPSANPSSQPSSLPTAVPISIPTCRPSSQPSSRPSYRPTGQPTTNPTNQPTSSPSSQPSSYPSLQKAPLSQGWLALLGPESYASNAIVLNSENHEILVCGGFQPAACFHLNDFTLTGRSYPSGIDFIHDMMLESIFNTFMMLVITELKTSELHLNCYLLQQSSSFTNINDRIQCDTIRFTNVQYERLSKHQYYDLYFAIGKDLSTQQAFVTFLNPGSLSTNPFTFPSVKESFSHCISSPLSPNAILAGVNEKSHRITLGLLAISPSPSIKHLVIIIPEPSTETASFHATIKELFILPNSQDFLISGSIDRSSASSSARSFLARISSLTKVHTIISSRVMNTRESFHAFFVVSDKLFGVYNDIVANTNRWSVHIVQLNPDTCERIPPIILIHSPPADIRCEKVIEMNDTGILLVCNYNQDRSLLLFTSNSLSFRNLPTGYRRILVKDIDEMQYLNLTIHAISNSITRGTYVFTPPIKSSMLMTTHNFTQILPESVAHEYPLPSRAPSISPSLSPIETSSPSSTPSYHPTARPTLSSEPSSQPSSIQPTSTFLPSLKPTEVPSIRPSYLRTTDPTPEPTFKPTRYPTRKPTAFLTRAPGSLAPSASPRPTRVPTLKASQPPTLNPTVFSEVVHTDSATLRERKLGFYSTWATPITAGFGNLIVAIIVWFNCYSCKDDETEEQDEKSVSIVSMVESGIDTVSNEYDSESCLADIAQVNHNIKSCLCSSSGTVVCVSDGLSATNLPPPPPPSTDENDSLSWQFSVATKDSRSVSPSIAILSGNLTESKFSDSEEKNAMENANDEDNEAVCLVSSDSSDALLQLFHSSDDEDAEEETIRLDVDIFSPSDSTSSSTDSGSSHSDYSDPGITSEVSVDRELLYFTK